MTTGDVSEPPTLRQPFRYQHDRTSLELCGDQVNDGVIAKLFGRVQLRELHIVGAMRVTNTGLSYIENLRTLEWLNLDGLAITDRGLFFIQKMKRLKGLQLTNAFLNGCGLEYLVALKRLQYLCLCGTAVDDNGIKTLAKLKNLRTLRLSQTAVTSKGVRKLRRLKKLRTLVLYQTHVSKQCVEKLRKAMPKCEIYWSAYEPPKLIAPKLPLLTHQRSQPITFQAGNVRRFAQGDSGWYLQFVSDFYRLQVERRKLSGTPSNLVATTDFKASQPAWIELLDWCSNQ